MECVPPLISLFSRKKSSFGPHFDGFEDNMGLKLNLSFITPKSTSLRDFTFF